MTFATLTRRAAGLAVLATGLATGAAAQQTFAITGRVVDAATDAPIQYTVIGIPELKTWDLTDSTGAFRLERVEAGTFRFIALRRGYYMADQAIRVGGPGDIVVELTVERDEERLGPGNLQGQVRDQISGEPLSDVQITVIPTNQTATTNPQGRFSITGISAGAIGVQFRRIGYEPRTDTLASFPGVTLEVQASMSPRPIQLDPIQVTALNPHLEANGFYRRLRSRSGTQITQADFERRNPSRVSDMLQIVSGASLRRGDFGEQVLLSRRGNCALDVWVDGVRMAGLDIDQYPPQWVDAVEVYVGVNTPAEYYSNCGVVLIWTKKGG